MSLVNKYSKFVSKHALLVLIIMIMLTIGAVKSSSSVNIENRDFKKFFPDDMDSIKALESMEDAFGSSDQAQFIIELDPKTISSNEPRDIRDPEIIKYSYQLENYASHVEYVLSISGPATLLKQANNNQLPKSTNEIKELERNLPTLQELISPNKEILVINIRLSEEADKTAIRNELMEIANNIKQPSGTITSVAGYAMTDPAIDEAISKDMSKTSTYSLIGILLVMLLVFMSIKYGLIPLTTIVFGIIWTFGFLGIMGINLSSSSSGVISMIMGIGIDFGIQVANRFRQELINTSKEKAMTQALNKVLVPMLTTTLAAVIGFKCMSLGQLTFLAEMGDIMSYGVVFCFLAAITIVPSTLVVLERNSKNPKNIKNNF